MWSSPSSTRDAIPSGRPEHYLQGRGCALTAHTERGSSAWHRPFDERPIIGASLDDGMCCARHLGGNGCKRFTPEIGIVAILGDGTLKLGSEAVVSLADRHLSCHPERTPQSGIAELRQLCLPSELSGLMCGQVKSAELQKLTVMSEAAQIACFR